MDTHWPSEHDMVTMKDGTRYYWNRQRKKHGLPPIYRPYRRQMGDIPNEHELAVMTGNRRSYWNRRRALVGLPKVIVRGPLRPYDQLKPNSKWYRDVRNGVHIPKPNSRTRDKVVIKQYDVTRAYATTITKNGVAVASNGFFQFPNKTK